MFLFDLWQGLVNVYGDIVGSTVFCLFKLASSFGNW